jgi:hypothetical protein
VRPRFEDGCGSLKVRLRLRMAAEFVEDKAQAVKVVGHIGMVRARYLLCYGESLLVRLPGSLIIAELLQHAAEVVQCGAYLGGLGP